METLLLWLLYISTLYAFIPGLITRIFGFRVFKRGISEKAFALTFDDGPDPKYTPQLLDLLKRHGAKATFFLVGSNAEKHPELIKRMYEEGHLIGSHNYVHKTNWLMGPSAVKKQIQKTNQIIYDVTGFNSHYYRPPWGIVNLFDFANRGKTQIVLWSAMFGDWRVKVGADRLTERMLKKLRGGEVFLLHDCGATLGANTGAPAEMLIALERVLKEADRRGLRSIRIDELIQVTEEAKLQGKQVETATPKGRTPVKITWFKRCIVALWLVWEKIFHILFQLKTPEPEDPFLHFRVRSYHGEPVEMNNGKTLQSGDQVMELHFDNKKLFEYGTRARTSVHLAIQMIRKVEKTLPLFAKYVIEHPELKEVKALYGVSMINRGPEQFGFIITDLPKGWFASSTKIYLKLLMSVIHPAGTSRLKEQPQELVPKMIVMPMDVLLERFAENGSHRSNHTVDEKPEAVEEESLLSVSLPTR
ncbi:polysaccharide deacetylase family protein [Paenibacillus barengoltzii]|jgi:peptidoglycan/xylan/chitin deacetylase (PgdA/CDA1 family)|uniref:Peptidoglycan/xylan/chitin deacetylase, PgdA/CDA1 family n=1 Tax=Paenibacillus barengoltzii J12 TaxID=935846 RepID=A0ABY1LS20_9BACL|nr:polysaccharide deacetylase family protein [Paenibacillus barengoltzii]MEC2343513.1 polysaccharide deacetylase family protein [Paenibacillus barengoltzii]SME92134.1 Peptidoglycan/xylan/chitin deacetylase, PgdA/CDA1 family [Paenibacillus barengoltzii J12]